MQISSIPTKIDIVWASAAGSLFTQPIPDTVQQPTLPYAASWPAGFPPDTFLPPASGGQGPDGRDVNGALQMISAWSQWQCAGGPIIYDSAFQTSVGGYPDRAMVQSAATRGVIWVSTADNNTTNPDSGGAGWANLFSYLTTAANTWSAANTFNGTVVFNGNVSLGSGATATTQAANTSNTTVATTAYADRSASSAAETAQSNAEAYSDSRIATLFDGSSNFRDTNGTREVWFDVVSTTGNGDLLTWPHSFGGTPYGSTATENDPSGWGGAGANPTIYGIGAMNAAQGRLYSTRYAAGNWGFTGGLSCHIRVWGPTP